MKDASYMYVIYIGMRYAYIYIYLHVYARMYMGKYLYVVFVPLDVHIYVYICIHLCISSIDLYTYAYTYNICSSIKTYCSCFLGELKLRLFLKRSTDDAMTNLKPFPPDTRDREVPVLESSVQVAVTGVTVAWLCCFFWWGPGGSRGRSSIIMIPKPY